MAGHFEVRVDGPGRHHYRLFCRLVSTMSVYCQWRLTRPLRPQILYLVHWRRCAVYSKYSGGRSPTIGKLDSSFSHWAAASTRLALVMVKGRMTGNSVSESGGGVESVVSVTIS